MAVGIVLGIHIVAVGAVGRGEKVTGPGIVLVLLHGAVVRSREDEEQAHHNGQQGVIVIGNGAQEHGKAVDAGASGTLEVTAAAQLDTGAMMHTGAAVESMR